MGYGHTRVVLALPTRFGQVPLAQPLSVLYET